MENGTWAPTTAKQMREKLAELKNVTILDTQITIKSAMAPEQEGQLEALADAIVASWISSNCVTDFIIAFCGKQRLSHINNG